MPFFVKLIRSLKEHVQKTHEEEGPYVPTEEEVQRHQKAFEVAHRIGGWIEWYLRVFGEWPKRLYINRQLLQEIEIAVMFEKLPIFPLFKMGIEGGHQVRYWGACVLWWTDDIAGILPPELM